MIYSCYPKFKVSAKSKLWLKEFTFVDMSLTNKGVISLLGCGWLGYPLAKSLISQGFIVRGTTTTPAKLELLQSEGIDSYLVHFTNAVSIPDLKKFFKAEILIITIPPDRRNPNGYDNYKRMIQYVCSQIQHSEISKLILISSTSVYPDSKEVVDELSMVLPDTESGRLMADTGNSSLAEVKYPMDFHQ